MCLASPSNVYIRVEKGFLSELKNLCIEVEVFGIGNITTDVEQTMKKLLANEFYIGLQQWRVSPGSSSQVMDDNRKQTLEIIDPPAKQ